MGKNQLAMVSFLIALVMTAIKVLVGLAAGSLGILSEAAHSGIDTAAVLMTYLAIRVSDKPADSEHTYGHGKIESLAALLQMFVLLMACLWIVREAVLRLLFKDAHVITSWWTFGVMALSIGIDYSRSRILARAARKFSSQALEADAYHFSIDMYSSALVIVTLVMGRVGDHFGANGVAKTADAMAALGIVCITLWFSLQLGRRAFDSLMDRAPAGIVDLVRHEVGRIENVFNPHRIRVRRSGPTVFVDLHIEVPRKFSSELSHTIGEKVERFVEQIVPNSQALVHVEPIMTADESLHERIRLIARNHAMTVHNIKLYQEKKHVHADLHLEVSDKLDLRQAHDEASKLEKWVRKELPDVRNVNIHIEGRRYEVEEGADVTGSEGPLVEAVRHAVGLCPEILNIHNIHVRKINDRLCVYLHCEFSQEQAIARVHEISTQIEDDLKARYPTLGRIMIHAEPQGPKR